MHKEVYQGAKYIKHTEGAQLGSIIFLHGLGASADDFHGLWPYLDFAAKPRVDAIFLQAPNMPVAINGGTAMPAWFDVYETDLGKSVDRAGITKSSDAVRNVIADEAARGVQNIVLVGFSQGGVISMDAAFSAASNVAHDDHRDVRLGVLGLSTFHPEPGQWKGVKHPPRVCLMHGRQDMVIPYELGYKTHEALSSEWCAYDMGHEITMPQLADMVKYLDAFLEG